MYDYSVFKNKITTSSVDELSQFVQNTKSGRASKFIWNTKNYFWGSDQWHSLDEARELLNYYTYIAGDTERTDDITNRVLKLYDELEKIENPALKKPYTNGISRKRIERLLKARSELPAEPPIIGSEEGLKRKPYLANLSQLPPVSAKTLFQVEADEFGLHSGLEGAKKVDILSFVLSYLQSGIQSGQIHVEKHEELLHEMNSALEILKAPVFSLELGKKIEESLKTGKPFLIPGGWVGLPSGHAMYYEFIPEEDGTITLRIFNTGDGLGEHQNIQTGVKDKVIRAEWRGIHPDRVKDPNFSKIIEEFNTRAIQPADDTKKTNYSFRDIYFGLKTFLGVTKDHTTDETPVLEAQAINPQLAGTCTFRSLLSFLKTKMALDEYRKFCCDIRIQGLVANHLQRLQPQNPQKEKISSQAEWRLVKRGLQTTSRKINRLLEKKVIGADYAIAAHEALQPVRQWVADKERVNSPTVETPLNNTFEVQKSMKFSYRSVRSFVTPQKESKIESASNLSQTANIEESERLEMKPIHSPAPQKIESLSFQDPTKFKSELEQLNEMLKRAFQNRQFPALHIGTIEAIRKITIDPKFWTSMELKREDVEKMVLILNTISEQIFVSCFNICEPGIIFEEQHHTAPKFVHLPTLLSQKLYPEIKMEANFYSKSNIFYHPCAEEIEHEESIFYRSNNASTPTLFRRTPFRDADKMITRISTDYGFGLGRGDMDFELLSTIIEKYFPEFLKKTISEHPNYLSLNREEQYALLYTKKDLPPTLTAMRDSKFRHELLLRNYVHPPRSPNHTFAFTHKATEKNNKVEIETTIDGFNWKDCELEKDDRIPFSLVHYEYPKKQRKTSNKDIQTLLNKMKQIEEKNIREITSDLKLEKMTRDEFKELLHPFITRTIKKSIIETVEYFSRHPDHLKNSDYQIVFTILLFGYRDAFLIQNDKDDFSLMAQFIKKQTANFLAQNDLTTSLFLLRMDRYLKHYSKYPSGIENPQRIIRGILKDSTLAVQDKGLLYSELLGYICELKNLSEEDVRDLLIGASWVQKYGLDDRWRDPQSKLILKTALTKHAMAIEEYLLPGGVPHQRRLDDLFKAITGKESGGEWSITSRAGEAISLKTVGGNIIQPFCLRSRDLTPSSGQEDVVHQFQRGYVLRF
jgi:hypothetical protein